ncbi:MAG: UDP-N-acetylglucosamine 2-epimerase (non-hydrolyzing) [Chloroflexi bacterium]|nr:UDP-N-acetylglucosamine 2-epimerase (non-hydrolyzing) [Chloroflexota bacterium]
MVTTRSCTLVVGTRPNFVKASPLLRALEADGSFAARLVHTGQHFDTNMSKVFFEQLEMPEPDAYLDVGAGTPTEQIARIMLAMEAEFKAHPPDWVLVFGDVNSTLAAALVANKLGLRLAHVEAGLRSFDRNMPEEHNRVLTDRLSDLLFTPSPDGDENLKKEGTPVERIHRVGNIMVDSLLGFLPTAETLDQPAFLGVEPRGYALVTLHRPSNVDAREDLDDVLGALMQIGEELPVIFPVHPRTRAKLEAFGFLQPLEAAGVQVIDPLGYLEFLNLMSHARVVLTDSGGIQEETTVLGVPCLTVRENTERPITISEGTNQLVGTSKQGILQGFEAAMQQAPGEGKAPALWDGQTAGRIVEVLKAQ